MIKPLTEGKQKHGVKPPAGAKPDVKPHGQRSGRQMTEEEIKDWQQAFINIDISIKGLYDERKSSKKSKKRSK